METPTIQTDQAVSEKEVSNLGLLQKLEALEKRLIELEIKLLKPLMG